MIEVVTYVIGMLILLGPMVYLELYTCYVTREFMKPDKPDKEQKKQVPSATLYYVWESISETDGVYTYYCKKSVAKKEYKRCKNPEKTYGTAVFRESKLVPDKLLGSTL